MSYICKHDTGPSASSQKWQYDCIARMQRSRTLTSPTAYIAALATRCTMTTTNSTPSTTNSATMATTTKSLHNKNKENMFFDLFLRES